MQLYGIVGVGGVGVVSVPSISHRLKTGMASSDKLPVFPFLATEDEVGRFDSSSSLSVP